MVLSPRSTHCSLASLAHHLGDTFLTQAHPPAQNLLSHTNQTYIHNHLPTIYFAPARSLLEAAKSLVRPTLVPKSIRGLFSRTVVAGPPAVDVATNPARHVRSNVHPRTAAARNANYNRGPAVLTEVKHTSTLFSSNLSQQTRIKRARFKNGGKSYPFMFARDCGHAIHPAHRNYTDEVCPYCRFCRVLGDVLDYQQKVAQRGGIVASRKSDPRGHSALIRGDAAGRKRKRVVSAQHGAGIPSQDEGPDCWIEAKVEYADYGPILQAMVERETAWFTERFCDGSIVPRFPWAKHSATFALVLYMKLEARVPDWYWGADGQNPQNRQSHNAGMPVRAPKSRRTDHGVEFMELAQVSSGPFDYLALSNGPGRHQASFKRQHGLYEPGTWASPEGHIKVETSWSSAGTDHFFWHKVLLEKQDIVGWVKDLLALPADYYENDQDMTEGNQAYGKANAINETAKTAGPTKKRKFAEADGDNKQAYGEVNPINDTTGTAVRTKERKVAEAGNEHIPVARTVIEVIGVEVDEKLKLMRASSSMTGFDLYNFHHAQEPPRIRRGREFFAG
ncbi:hypothetical protein M011DRAFT_473588 [Sporormia fimetaria CBS 119925]|uniref:Uncharacterized protein n=1 Tax=Sporormia fimetaria CBS 119925 TaxID=1340428 RepID=A0A6A6VND7_9PLEO|nr:hypothetical protein M011DRAFT_473588 [Sporormia fimetaria CBS 119925]